MENVYSFFDETANSGLNFYRLKMMDKDGKWTYSFILKIYAGLKQDEDLVIAPNPVQSRITINTNYSYRQNILIRILDGTGKPVHSQNESTVTGNNTFTVENLRGLPPGVYVLEIQDETSSRRKKFILIE